MAAFAGCATAQLSRQQKVKLDEEWDEARWADFSLAGQIVDEQGAPVRDMAFLVESSERGSSSKPPKYKTVSSADGSFNIKRDSCSSVRFFISKEGYYSQRINFSPSDRPKDWAQRVLRGEKPRPGKVIRDDLKIVLEKHGPLADLRESIAMLRVDASGIGTLGDLGISGGRDVDLKDWKDESKYPERCIYLSVDVDEQGKILTDKLVDKWGHPALVPRRVRLIMKDDGGFVPAAFMGDQGKTYRSMQEAPEAGYVKEIVLGKQLLLEHRDRSIASGMGGDFLYFKTSKGYGKACYRINWSTDVAEVRTGVILRLQEDGSRLVATED